MTATTPVRGGAGVPAACGESDHRIADEPGHLAAGEAAALASAVLVHEVCARLERTPVDPPSEGDAVI